MSRKGFVRPGKNCLLVGAEDKETNYSGPVAVITHDKDWLHIVTDDYEGHAMLNIEALPSLQRALSQIARERKAKAR